MTFTYIEGEDFEENDWDVDQRASDEHGLGVGPVEIKQNKHKSTERKQKQAIKNSLSFWCYLPEDALSVEDGFVSTGVPHVCFYCRKSERVD